jgi:hypothetical protein
MLPEDSPLVVNVDQYKKEGVYPVVESEKDFTFGGVEATIMELRATTPRDHTYGALQEM